VGPKLSARHPVPELTATPEISPRGLAGLQARPGAHVVAGGEQELVVIGVEQV
jgi:hypothetical protein